MFLAIISTQNHLILQLIYTSLHVLNNFPLTKLSQSIKHVAVANDATQGGGVAKRSNAAVCKTVIHGFESRLRLQLNLC